MTDRDSSATPPAPATQAPPAAHAAGGPPTRPAKPAPKAGPEPRRPYHVAVVLGLSTGLYAISLAGVTSLQVASDRALIAEREPVRQAIDMLAEHHERMIRNVDAARLRFEAASGAYGDLADQLTMVEGGLADLGGVVSSLEGTALRLPDRLTLPAVPRTTKVRSTSGSGGGSGSGSSGASSGGSSAAAAPPPTHGKSGASGGKP